MSVAHTIVEQLGGNRFAAMTGAKQFTFGSNQLTFRLPGGGGFCKDGINMVRITLEPTDEYTMEFMRVRGCKFSVVARNECLTWDMLRDCFEDKTGLRTSL